MKITDKKYGRFLAFVVLSILQPVNATTLVDPTRPYDANRLTDRQIRSADSYTLDSTLVSPYRRVAVINGSQVTVGETIGNATVLRIRRQDVLLQSPNRKITLKLFPDTVKTQP